MNLSATSTAVAIRLLALGATVAAVGGMIATGPRIGWWLLVPAFAVVLLDTGVAVNRQTQVVVASGILVGFSLLTLWSAGRFFFPAAGIALLLFAATMLSRAQPKARQPLWFFWGVSAVFAFNAALLKALELVALAGQRIERYQLGPAVFFGALLFGALSVALLVEGRLGRLFNSSHA